jgi:hypothetical protein
MKTPEEIKNKNQQYYLKNKEKFRAINKKRYDNKMGDCRNEKN